MLIGVIVIVASPLMSGVTQPKATAAARATNWLQNGSFEDVTGGVPNHWMVEGRVIDLGVTTLGGCVSVDTTDYSTYRGGQTSDVTNGTHSSFTVSIVNSGGFGVPAQGSNAVFLNLGNGNADPGYHIKHGPAIVSATFKAIAGQVITLNWYSAAGSDDFAVLGYLLDTDANGNGVVEGTAADCAQTEILDTHGKTVSGWQFASVTVPHTRDFYKFVFVNGTHDESGGRASGASFWVDNISQGTPQTVTFSLASITANYASGNITAPFQLPGTSTSGMALSYASSTTSRCTVTSGGMLTVLSAGTCTITATQTGGETGGTLYASSPSVTQSFTITAIAATAQTITFAAPANRLATDADFDLSATASSGMTVTFTSSTPSVCTVTGVTVDLLTAGTCTIVAAQAGGVNSGTNYAVAPTVTRSFLSQGSQTITFGTLSDKDPTAANFAVSATSSAGLTVTYTTTSTGICSVTSGGTVTILGPGTCTISANQAGGATGGITYAAATSVTQSFNVRTGQTITFAAPAPVDEDAATFALTGTASSGLAVTYTSSTPAVCTVTSDGNVSMVSFGTCTITAAQVGGTNSGTDYAAAPSVTRSFVSRRLQTITFGALSDKDPTAANFAVSGTASSGLTVTYTTTSTGVCSVTSAGTVTILGPGTCTINAIQAGGVTGGITYAAATSVTQSFTVRTGQTITFAAPSPVDEDAATFALTGTASSGLAVTYTSSTPAVCTVTSDGNVSMVSFGTCTITAAQVGGTNSGTDYAAAPSVTRSFVSRKLQTITFGTIADKDPTAADFSLSASASSTLAVTYTSSTPAICTVTSGGLVSVVAPGTCTIEANQAGGLSGGITYAVAPAVSQTFTVRTAQTITFAAPATVDQNAADFSLAATASSTLAVTYTTSTPSVCTVTSAGTVTMVSFGTCTITAAQVGGVSGGTSYAAATSVTHSFTSRRLQTITFTVLSDKSIMEPAFTVSGSTTSGLALTYSTTTTSVCTVTSSGTVTLVATGLCTIEAAQAGGVSGGITYAVATPVTQSFMIRTIQTITFALPADRPSTAASFSIGATASSGLPVTYVSSTPSVCTVTSSGTVTLVTFGACTIVASQVGGVKDGTTYEAAFDVSRTFNSLRNQTVTFTVPADRLYTAADFALTGSASSTLAVSYSTTTPSVCTVTPTGTVDLIAPGTCTINGVQAGGTAGGIAYAASPVVTRSITVNPLPQTVSMPSIPESHEYQGGVDLAGTTTSGLEITYSSTTPTVCTVTGKRVTFVGVGKCTIKGTQAGGIRGGLIYGASPDSTREFFVTNYTPTATLTPTNTRTFTPTMTPTPVPFLMKKGAVGASFVLGLLQNGTLITWGMNREFQANIPPCCGSGIDDVAVGTNFALALKGGRVFGWGANTKGQLRFPASTARNITAIAAGGAHGLALNKTGQVFSWGDNGFKQALVPKALKDVTQIAGGTNHSLVITKAGRVVAWGSNSSNQSKPPTTLSNVIQVAGGLDHSLALRRDGTVVAWGGNAFGQGAVPATAINVKQVSAGNQFSLVVQNDGTVFGWGRNENNVYVIPPEYTDIYTVAAGYANTILGLRSGRVIVIGDQTNGIDASRTPTRTATPTP
jgi:hypothetical protein